MKLIMENPTRTFRGTSLALQVIKEFELAKEKKGHFFVPFVFV